MDTPGTLLLSGKAFAHLQNRRTTRSSSTLRPLPGPFVRCCLDVQPPAPSTFHFHRPMTSIPDHPCHMGDLKATASRTRSIQNHQKLPHRLHDKCAGRFSNRTLLIETPINHHPERAPRPTGALSTHGHPSWAHRHRTRPWDQQPPRPRSVHLDSPQEESCGIGGGVRHSRELCPVRRYSVAHTARARLSSRCACTV